MPDPDDRMTTWPEAGSPAAHPVLEAMAEAAGVVSDAAAYLSPTREFDEPSLEEGDWPRDLDGPETLRMVGHLADVAYGASRCITGITCQHAIPDAAKPQLDVIADLLAEAGRKLSALTGTPGREAEAASPAQHAGLDFPAGPTLTRPATPPRRACQEPQPRPPLVPRSRHHDTRPVSAARTTGRPAAPSRGSQRWPGPGRRRARPDPAAHPVPAVPLPRPPSAASSGPQTRRSSASCPEPGSEPPCNRLLGAGRRCRAFPAPLHAATAITRRNRQELAMPDQEHLILVLARDAEEITRDISVFFAPTRDFIEPGAGWPQDLTRAELAALIPYLRRTIGSLSDVITHVAADNRADPGESKGGRRRRPPDRARRRGNTGRRDAIRRPAQPAGHPLPAGRGHTGLPGRSCRRASQRRLARRARGWPPRPAPAG